MVLLEAVGQHPSLSTCTPDQENREKRSHAGNTSPHFVQVGKGGKMNKFAIAQVRSHVAIHASRKVRTTTQMQAPFLILVLFQEQPRRRNRPGLIFFGGQYDPFHILPQLPMEQELPGSLSMVKSYSSYTISRPMSLATFSIIDDADFHSVRVLGTTGDEQIHLAARHTRPVLFLRHVTPRLLEP